MWLIGEQAHMRYYFQDKQQIIVAMKVYFKKNLYLHFYVSTLVRKFKLNNMKQQQQQQKKLRKYKEIKKKLCCFFHGNLLI